MAGNGQLPNAGHKKGRLTAAGLILLIVRRREARGEVLRVRV